MSECQIVKNFSSQSKIDSLFSKQKKKLISIPIQNSIRKFTVMSCLKTISVYLIQVALSWLIQGDTDILPYYTSLLLSFNLTSLCE